MTIFRQLRFLVLLVILPGADLCADPLPEPLTLAAALATADNSAHFELIDIDQRMQALRAEIGVENGSQDFRLDLTGRIREIGPSVAAPNDDSGDNAASLILTKPLYDFGQQDSRTGRLGQQLQALELQKRLLIERRRLDIMEKYFAVLDADNRFLSENEALAIGYIRYDRARQDQELGATAEIEVVRLQAEYEAIRRQHKLAEQQQRLLRSVLAEAMGYPGQLSSNLEIPTIDISRRLPNDYDALVAQALQYSLEALVALANTRAAHAAIKIAEATDGPSLDLELEVSTYERDTGTRDDWRAGLNFAIPLYRGSSAARVNLASAQYQRSLAQQQHLQSQLRIEVLRLWQQLQQLQLEIRGKSVEQDYRDRYLDRSRAEYELEFKTDLGDAMVLYSRSTGERLRTLYAFELAYQRLAALVGIEFLQASTPPQ